MLLHVRFIDMGRVSGDSGVVISRMKHLKDAEAQAEEQKRTQGNSPSQQKLIDDGNEFFF